MDVELSEEMLDELILRKHAVTEDDVDEEKSKIVEVDIKANAVIVDVSMRTLPFTHTMSDLVNGEVVFGEMEAEEMVRELFVGDAEHADVTVKREMEVTL